MLNAFYRQTELNTRPEFSQRQLDEPKLTAVSTITDNKIVLAAAQFLKGEIRPLKYTDLCFTAKFLILCLPLSFQVPISENKWVPFSSLAFLQRFDSCEAFQRHSMISSSNPLCEFEGPKVIQLDGRQIGKGNQLSRLPAHRASVT